MDAREFYAQIDKAYNEIIDINKGFLSLRLKTQNFASCLEELARDAANIKDKDKNEKFCSVLSYLSEKIYEFDKQDKTIDSFLDSVRHYDFIELVNEAEEMAKEEEEKDFSEADNN